MEALRAGPDAQRVSLAAARRVPQGAQLARQRDRRQPAPGPGHSSALAETRDSGRTESDEPGRRRGWNACPTLYHAGDAANQFARPFNVRRLSLLHSSARCGLGAQGRARAAGREARAEALSGTRSNGVLSKPRAEIEMPRERLSRLSVTRLHIDETLAVIPSCAMSRALPQSSRLWSSGNFQKSASSSSVRKYLVPVTETCICL